MYIHTYPANSDLRSRKKKQANLEAKIAALEHQIADVTAQEEEIRAKLKWVVSVSCFFLGRGAKEQWFLF